jgi:hypothetical protein
MQLGYKLGGQRLHHDGQKQEQPVWNCIRCNLSNSLKIVFFFVGHGNVIKIMTSLIVCNY